MKNWLKPLAVAAPVLSAVFSGPASAAEENDRYKILLSLQSKFSASTYAKPCTLDAAQEIQCEGPIIDLRGKTISAILQSEKDGALVLCNYHKISTAPGGEALFDSMKGRLYITGAPGALSTVESLRPPAAQQPGSQAYGSCQPYETPVSAREIESFKNRTSWPSYEVIQINFGSQAPGMGFGASIFIDDAKEHRMFMTRALKDQFPLLKVEDPLLGSPYYYPAVGAACRNTGDFTMAEKIQDAFDNGSRETVTVPLARCPAP